MTLMSRSGRLALVLAIMSLIAWTRARLVSLPAIEGTADRLVRDRVRAQFVAEIPRTLAAAERHADLERRVERWISDHPDRFAAAKGEVTTRLREDFSYVDANGMRHPYLGDIDSYTWLREARNYLRTGTTCDAVVDGECRDTLTLAPVGTRMRYPRSMHIAAIVILHRLIGLVREGFPLPASAMLVPIVVATTAVAPAFAIGSGLAGICGGLVAAVVGGLSPDVLMRTSGSDNDIWNVTLPLVLVWAAIAAVGATRMRARAGYSVLAGSVAVAHAVTWKGWFVTYFVVLGGLGASILLSTARTFVEKRRFELAEAKTTGLVLLTICVVAGLGTLAAGVRPTAFAAPNLGVSLPFGSSSVERIWPDLLGTVAEEMPAGFAHVVQSIGGPVIAVAGIAGVLILGLELLRADSSDVRGHAARWIVILWFAAAAYLAQSAVRHLFLFAPPFAIAFGVTVGRAAGWVSQRARRVAPNRPLIARALAFTCVAAALFIPVRRGEIASAAYVPRIDRAWWDTFTEIGRSAPPDAIVTADWEYGYWAKYLAERRVSADGASLQAHAPYWIARALATDSERESIGVLRMLDCGSDATPFPEGHAGAYAKVFAKTHDLVAAVSLVHALTLLDPPAAAKMLTARGFSPSERDDVLRSTHCTPPEGDLVVGSRDIGTALDWMRVGSWNFERAYVLDQARRSPGDEAVGNVAGRLSLSRSEARGLVEESLREGDDFVVPRATFGWQYFFSGSTATHRWSSCGPTTEEPGVLACPVDLVGARSGLVIREFRYDLLYPEKSRLLLTENYGGQVASVSATPPAALLVATADELRDIALPQGQHPDLGVLFDRAKLRVLVGTPAFLRSTFTKLLFLDGRFTSNFEKVAERSTLLGERVQTWRVRWDAGAAPH